MNTIPTDGSARGSTDGSAQLRATAETREAAARITEGARDLAISLGFVKLNGVAADRIGAIGMKLAAVIRALPLPTIASEDRGEVERLRAALRKIDDLSRTKLGEHPVSQAMRLLPIGQAARAALITKHSIEAEDKKIPE